MRTQDQLALLTLGALKGSAYLITAIAVPAFGPVALIDARMFVALLLLLAWVAVRGGVPPFWRRWRAYAVLGAINVAVPYTLLAWALLTVVSSFAAIIMATIPLFTALFAAIRLHEWPSARQVLGLATGFAGVGLLVGFEPLATSPTFLVAAGALIAAAMLWALAAIYAASQFAGVSPMEIAIGQIAGAFVLLLPLALVTLPPAWPSPQAIAAMLALAVQVTAVSTLLAIYLLFAIGPTRSWASAYLSPLFATICGVLILHEQVGGVTILGMAAILAGVFLANQAQGAPWRRLVTRPTSTS